MKKIKLGAFLLCALAATVSQSEAKDVFMLPEVVVTATHTENTLEKVPVTMQVITQKDIKRSGAYDLRSLLRHETGIMLKTALRGGGHEVMIRGVDSDKTLILIDGRRMIDEADSSGLGNKKGIDRININEIERIEIVKGPSSALYGSDAIGGVIHIITKKSKEKSTTIGATRTETDATGWYRFDSGRQGNISATADIKVNKTFRDKIAEYEKSNNYGTDQNYDFTMNYFMDDDNYFTAYYNYYSRHGQGDNGDPKKPLVKTDGMPGGMPGKGGKPNVGKPGGMGGMSGNSNAGKSGGMGGMSGNPNAGMPGGMPGKGGKPNAGMPGGNDMGMKMMKWKMEEYKAVKDFSDHYQKQTYGLSYNGKKENYTWHIQAYGGTFDWYDDYVRNGRLEDINENQNKLYAIEGQTTIIVNPVHRITLGGEYVYNFVKGTNLGEKGKNIEKYKDLITATPMGDESHTKYMSEENISTRAIYLQDEISIGKFFLVPAVRYDYHSVFGGHTSWKWGMTYMPTKELRVKMNYGDGFKAPSVCQLYFDIRRLMGPQYVTVYGNPDLKPEKSKNFDISVEMNKGQWNTSLTYFDNHIDNLIKSEALDEVNHIYQFKNISKAHIKGIEHALGYHINDFLEFRVATTWTTAKDDISGEYLMQRPRMTQLYQLMYNDGKDNGFNATLWCERYRDFYYTGGSRMHPVISRTSYHIFGLTMSQGISSGTRIFGTIENIFDKKDLNADIEGRFCTIGFEHKF
ncbi:TonB-dependent receptor plug domain protein [Veillonellaceae bacterium DNF00626]|nr:TonB-dependent receptor plug domain protein [Veillonellaceae bacterium DNF00626]